MKIVKMDDKEDNSEEEESCAICRRCQAENEKKRRWWHIYPVVGVVSRCFAIIYTVLWVCFGSGPRMFLYLMVWAPAMKRTKKAYNIHQVPVEARLTNESTYIATDVNTGVKSHRHRRTYQIQISEDQPQMDVKSNSSDRVDLLYEREQSEPLGSAPKTTFFYLPHHGHGLQYARDPTLDWNRDIEWEPDGVGLPLYCAFFMWIFGTCMVCALWFINGCCTYWVLAIGCGVSISPAPVMGTLVFAIPWMFGGVFYYCDHGWHAYGCYCCTKEMPPLSNPWRSVCPVHGRKPVIVSSVKVNV